MVVFPGQQSVVVGLFGECQQNQLLHVSELRLPVAMTAMDVE